MIGSNRPKISIAPMVDCTDRHYRYLMRLISPKILLYTPMITTGALLHGDAEKTLSYDVIEHPLAIQLGGADPDELAQCAAMAAQAGYDEINLNVGCPSSRVKKGRFGACLMREPQLVADCVAAMRQATTVPVTVKTRIGVDERDSYHEFTDFIATVAKSGCELFIIHARKAWLEGLNPKQNREIPPLMYEYVYQLQADFPTLHIELNGGLTTKAQIQAELANVPSVMLGRVAYANPYFIASLNELMNDEYLPDVHTVFQQYLPYAEQQLAQGVKLMAMGRHLLNLFHGLPGARLWRRYLSEHGYADTADLATLRAAYNAVNL